MSRPGYRNGFNPFRRGGKFATPATANGSSDAGAGAAAASLGVENSTIGTDQVNAAIRAAAGRPGISMHGGGAAAADVPALSPVLGNTTLARGNVGSGRASLLQNIGTDNEHIAAIDRAPAKGASKEEPFTKPRISAATQALIEEAGDIHGELAQIMGGDPVSLYDNLSYLATNIPGGLAIAHGALRDNGFIPAKATIQHVDDLLATRYERETGAQRAMRMMRAMGTAIAAGHDPENVITQMGDATSPSQDYYAMSVAAEAGQAPDAATLKARGF